MRTDVKLGIVLGLVVLAVVFGWHLRSDKPERIPLADAADSSGTSEGAEGGGAALPQPVFPKPKKGIARPTMAAPRPATPKSEAAKPKKKPSKPEGAMPKLSARPPAKPKPSPKPTSSAPAVVARTSANRALTVDSAAAKPARPPAKTPPAAPVKPSGLKLPIVRPPGAKPRPEANRPASVPPAGPAAEAKKPDRKPAAKPPGAPIRPTATLTPPKPRGRLEPKPKRPPKPKTRVHVVEQYESFATVAEKYYGSQRLAGLLLKANPHVQDPRRMKVGTKLRIPPKDELMRPPGAPKAAPKDKAPPAAEKRSRKDAISPPTAKRAPKEKVYIVKEDDNFYAIARKVLGSGARWRELHKLNKDVCPDPDRLMPGMKLRLTAPKAKAKVRKDAPAKRATTRSRPRGKPSTKPVG